ncbi:hypothetical protein [Acetivibrio cellulolyticus]
MSFISESITEVVVNYTTVCFEALTIITVTDSSICLMDMAM